MMDTWDWDECTGTRAGRRPVSHSAHFFLNLKARHDEEAIYEENRAQLRARGAIDASASRFDLFGFLLSYKSVLLEGLEVAFIVITFGLSAATSTVSRSSGIASAAL